MTGWALDDVGVSRVDIFRSSVAGEPAGLLFVGRAVFIRGARPDVQSLFPNAADNDNGGWGFMVLTNFLPNQGNGTFTLHAYAYDGAGLQTLLGSRRIVAANSTSVKPFGTIDTPGQGETVSGSIVNFGWALTPSRQDDPDQRQHHRRVRGWRLSRPSGVQQLSRRHRGALPRAEQHATAPLAISCSTRRRSPTGCTPFNGW